MNVQGAIKTRKSVRKYTSEKVDVQFLQQIQVDLDNYTPTFSDTKVRFQITNNYDDTQKTKIGFLHGLGKINAPCCIVGICGDDNQGMLELGFALEQTVLKLTDAGYATCWLGTFDKTTMAEMCSLQENEKVGIVIAVGYEKNDAFMNNGFRRIAGSVKRKSFDEISIKSSYTDADCKVKKIINLSILAPSANNVQPVRVSADHSRADFYLIENSKIDVGIFMSHFYLCAI